MDLVVRSLRRTAAVIAFQAIVFLPFFLILTLEPEMRILSESALAIRRLAGLPVLVGMFVIAFNLFLIGLFIEWFELRTRIATHPLAGISIRSAVSFFILLPSGSLYALLAGASCDSLAFVSRWTTMSLTVAIAIPLLIFLLKRESTQFWNLQRTQTIIAE